MLSASGQGKRGGIQLNSSANCYRTNTFTLQYRSAPNNQARTAPLRTPRYHKLSKALQAWDVPSGGFECLMCRRIVEQCGESIDAFDDAIDRSIGGFV
jgi:hypothetical protein